MNRFTAPAPLSPELTIALMAQRLAKTMRKQGWCKLNDLKLLGYSDADIRDLGPAAIELAKKQAAARQRAEATRRTLAEGALTTATGIAAAFFCAAVFLLFMPDTAMAATPDLASLTAQIDSATHQAITATCAALGLAIAATLFL